MNERRNPAWLDYLHKKAKRLLNNGRISKGVSPKTKVAVLTRVRGG